ncbi:hypothetical protein C0991_005813 [Blastosporella zonata]|nr:hypothetical protein C0991_005813 [Blastosporella zonata]
MPPLSRLVKRLILVNRATSNKEPIGKASVGVAMKTDETPIPHALAAVPVTDSSFGSLAPTARQSRLPQELYERIIDHLHNHVLSLLACSLVCRAWVPASRYHLFVGRGVVRPSRLAWPGRRNISINCAVSLRESGPQLTDDMYILKVCLDIIKHILYGTDDGIYISRTSDTPPARILSLVDPVNQIDVIEDFGIIIFLSGQPSVYLQRDIKR